MFKLLLQFIFAITVAASEFESLGPQDMVDLNQDDNMGKKRLEPLNFSINGHIEGANNFSESGNNISSFAKQLSEKNVTLNRNYLLAEELWGKPVFYEVDAETFSFPGLDIHAEDTFYSYPCLVWKYDCPKVMGTLWAFKHGDSFCYVPWPGYQLVQYAECYCEYCLAPFQLGTCQQSDFELRNFVVLCLNPDKSRWKWQYVTKYVPMGCKCRTC